MSKTLIGIVAFGNLEFTKLCVRSIRETATKPVDILIVAAKPGDIDTIAWLLEQRKALHWIRHAANKGFPASVNDIYDYAFKSCGYGAIGKYDHCIIAGNDTIAYPGAIDAMIEVAETTDMEWVSASQFDVKSLYDRYPEVRQYFKGDNMIFTDFNARPWEIHKDFREPFIEPGVIKDVHNFCLFKKSVIEKIGYVDANFYPAYFSDNDYCMRGSRAKLKTCNLAHAAYFHFWSRTIHQGSGGSTGRFFAANQRFYIEKWGAMPPDDLHKFALPFNGKEFCLQGPNFKLACPNGLNIQDRSYESAAAEYWKVNA